MRANETRTEKSLNQVSSPVVEKYMGVMEKLKRLVEVKTSSVDQNEIRGKVEEIIRDMEYYALADFSREPASDVQKQSARIDQVDFGVSIRKIGDTLDVTVSIRGTEPIVGTLSIHSRNDCLQLRENTIELRGRDIVTSKTPHKSFPPHTNWRQECSLVSSSSRLH